MTTRKNLRIGEFIANKLSISDRKIKEMLNMQEYMNEKIGEIATREKYINKTDLESILKFQKKHHISFGNAALYTGLMKNMQIKYLLDVQAQDRHRIGELLVEQGIVNQEKLVEILGEFYSRKQFPFTILALIGDSLDKEVQRVAKIFHCRFHSYSDEKEMASQRGKLPPVCVRTRTGRRPNGAAAPVNKKKFAKKTQFNKFAAQIKKLNPQLILFDQGMRKAMEYALNIKQAFPSRSLKIAVFSAKKKKLEMITGYEYGIDYILPVPFDTKCLINIMIDTQLEKGKKRKERILIVDDSPVVRKSVEQELVRSGFQTLFAENGKQAVEIAALEQPDLIIMDINMPVMDGYEACLQLKSQKITGGIPIIILTTNNTREEKEKGFEVGATEYFTKPFTRGHLSSYIRHLLSGNKKIRPERILIAEDSMICMEIYKSIFNKYGFRYEIAENGQQVFDILENGFEPSSILLDCNMPVMDGFETCRILKGNEKYRHIPVIMVTVSKEKEDILKGLKTGADDYITKPFDADELVARIEAHIKSFSLFNKLQEQNKLLQKREEALSRANEEIKSFANIISHDLRAPLVNLKGFSHELQRSCKEIEKILKKVSPRLTEKERKRVKVIFKEDITEALGFIDSSASTMNRMISNILNISRIGKRDLQLKEIKTNKLVREKIKALRHQVDSRGIKVTLNTLPNVIADETSLEQIFGNILSNAINYLVPARPGMIEISGEKQKEDTLFYVKDNGCGIANENKQKIFQLFRRAAKHNVLGEGMGLAYVKAILERSGGKIWFESEEGVGTTFYFTIPDRDSGQLAVNSGQ